MAVLDHVVISPDVAVWACERIAFAILGATYMIVFPDAVRRGAEQFIGLNLVDHVGVGTYVPGARVGMNTACLIVIRRFASMVLAINHVTIVSMTHLGRTYMSLTTVALYAACVPVNLNVASQV